MKKLNILWTMLFIGVMSFGQTPIITMIADGDCSGGNPKVVEIYADGTVDFSNYSLEKSPNGGAFGNTLNLGDLGIVTDEFVYITNNLAIFNTEFPSASNVFETNSQTVNFNGDDAIRIVNGSSNTIDQYGNEVDGTGTAWEYKDGYAKRVNGTSANGGFVQSDWIYARNGLNGGGTCQESDTFETIMEGIGTFEVSGQDGGASATEVATIAELRASTQGEMYMLTGEAVLTMQQAFRNQKWIEDSTAAILIDDNSNVITTAYNMYDGITGITGTLGSYNGVLQFVPSADPGMASSTGNIITPQLVSIPNFTANPEMYESELIKFDNIVTNAAGNWAAGENYGFIDEYANPLNVRTQFADADYIGEPISTEIIDLVGIAGSFNGLVQVYPRSTEDLIANENPCAMPTNIMISDITTDGFTVSWDASPVTVLGYLVGIVLEGEDPLGGSGFFTTSTSYTVTGLDPNTSYDVAVVAQCGPESVSSPLRTTAMTDQEVTPSLTCVEGAEVIAVEDFDSPSWNNDIRSFLFVDPNSSNQGLFIQAASSSNTNFMGNTLFGRDMGGESGEPTASPFTFTFDTVDVSDYTDIKFSFDYFVFGNAEVGSYTLILDGVEQQAVEFYNDPDNNNGPAVGTIIEDIPNGTQSVALIVNGTLNGSSDVLELDNFKLCGILTVSECLPPSNVVITRLSDTTAELTSADNMDAHYQGTANRAGRPLRPTPLYGMTDMTVGHVQQDLIPVFEYDLWFRTICDDGSFTEWVGPVYLPTYNQTDKPAISLYPNPTRGEVSIKKIDAQTVEVFNMGGYKLMNLKANANKFNISQLPTGKYNLRITDVKGNVHFEQVIKK